MLSPCQQQSSPKKKSNDPPTAPSVAQIPAIGEQDTPSLPSNLTNQLTLPSTIPITTGATDVTLPVIAPIDTTGVAKVVIPSQSTVASPEQPSKDSNKKSKKSKKTKEKVLPSKKTPLKRTDSGSLEWIPEEKTPEPIHKGSAVSPNRDPVTKASSADCSPPIGSEYEDEDIDYKCHPCNRRHVPEDVKWHTRRCHHCGKNRLCSHVFSHKNLREVWWGTSKDSKDIRFYCEACWPHHFQVHWKADYIESQSEEEKDNDQSVN